MEAFTLFQAAQDSTVGLKDFLGLIGVVVGGILAYGAQTLTKRYEERTKRIQTRRTLLGELQTGEKREETRTSTTFMNLSRIQYPTTMFESYRPNLGLLTQKEVNKLIEYYSKVRLHEEAEQERSLESLGKIFELEKTRVEIQDETVLDANYIENRLQQTADNIVGLRQGIETARTNAICEIRCRLPENQPLHRRWRNK